MRILYGLFTSCAVFFATASYGSHSSPPVVHSIYWSDGDSGWINGYKTGYPFRLANLEAPPLDGCPTARKVAYEAKAFMVNSTRDPEALVITKFYYIGPYRRNVIDLSVSGGDLGQKAMNIDLVRQWRFNSRGKPVQKRPSWC